MKNLVTLEFEGQPIRRVQYQGEWWFSIIDIIAVLTESSTPKRYWSDMKSREPQLYEICVRLKMTAQDGKQRETDAVNFQNGLRLIQSIPSKKAEPLKRELARLAKEKIEELVNPELAIDRAIENYKKRGYDEDWIQRRLTGVGTRKELTQEWQDRGCDKPHHFMNLTALQNKETFGLTPKQHKEHKGLADHHSLRDHKTKEELALDIFVETMARSLHLQNSSHGYHNLKVDVQVAGQAGASAREIMEKTLGRNVLSSWNAIEQRKRARKKIS